MRRASKRIEDEIQKGRIEILEEVVDDVGIFHNNLENLLNECNRDTSKKIKDLDIETLYKKLWPIMNNVEVLYRAIKKEKEILEKERKKKYKPFFLPEGYSELVMKELRG